MSDSILFLYSKPMASCAPLGLEVLYIWLSNWNSVQCGIHLAHVTPPFQINFFFGKTWSGWSVLVRALVARENVTIHYEIHHWIPLFKSIRAPERANAYRNICCCWPGTDYIGFREANPQRRLDISRSRNKYMNSAGKKLWTSISVWNQQVWTHQVWTQQVWTQQVWTQQVWTEQVWTQQAWTQQVWTQQVWTQHVWTQQAWIRQVWTRQVWTQPVTGMNSVGMNSTGMNSTGMNSTGMNSAGMNSAGMNSTGYRYELSRYELDR